MIVWLLVVVLSLQLLNARRELKALRARLREDEAQPSLPKDNDPGSQSGLKGAHQDLIVLRLELKRMTAAGALAEDLYQRLTQAIDAQWTAELSEAPSADGMWRHRSTVGWRVLAAQGRVPYGPPPWQQQSPATAQRQPNSERTADLSLTEQSLASAAERVWGSAEVSQPLPVSTLSQQPDRAGSGSEAGGDQVRSKPLPTRPSGEKSAAADIKPAGETPSRSVWQAEEPGFLESTLGVISGWPRAVIPFLLQNIGWFIGGFCFLAGSIFLVSYTSGFTKSLLVFLVLFGFNLLLFWAGYQLRLKRPALRASSATLMVIALLLVPVNISVTVRLLVSSEGSWWLGAMSLSVSLLTLGALLFATQVVSGVMDRALQGQREHLTFLRG
jgi:hypothetical protein